MKLFGKIRSSIGEKRLERRLRTLVRNKQTHNFNTARTAGILFNPASAEEFRLVKEFSKYLAGLKIECSLLGYYAADEIPGDFLFRDNVTIFCSKDLDFVFRPAHPDALAFMARKSDILFDLSLTNFFPLRYISTLSPSSFKVGRYYEGRMDMDMMIDIRTDQNVGFLIEQIKNYVTILNNPSGSTFN